MAYTEKDIKSTVEEMRQSFGTLYEDCKFRWDILHRRHGPIIEKELEKLGYPRIRSVVSPEVSHAAKKVVGILGSPQYEVHVEPHRDTDKSKADRLELIDSNLLLRLDSGGELSSAIHWHQAASPYAPLWVEKNPYNLPKRRKGRDGEYNESLDDYSERADAWRRTYTAFRVGVGDPTDTVFFEKGNLDVTLGSRKFEMPVIDFVQDYGDYDREAYAAGDVPSDLLVQVWNKEFDHLRGGYSLPEGSGVFSSQRKIEIVRYDNGVKICDYVVVPVGSGGSEYRSVGDMTKEGGWDNPFGRVTLVVIPGVYDSTASAPEDRYQPILADLYQSRWNLDFTWSQWASKAAERPKYTAPLPPEIQGQLMGMPREQREEYLTQVGELRDNVISPTFGKVDNLDAKQNVYEQTLYQEQHGEHFAYLPQSAFSGTETSQTVLKNTPTSSLLRMDELESMDYEPAFRYKFNGLLRLLEMNDNFYINRKDDKELSDEDKTYYTVTTGAERRQGKTTARGEKVEFKASEFDFPFDRSISRVDNRVSTQISQLAAIKERMTMPNGDIWVTDEEIAVALGKADATAYLKKVRIETRYKRIEMLNDNLNQAAATRRNALMLGINTQDLLLNMSAAPPGGGGSPPKPPGPTVQQMGPPIRDPAGLTAGATQGAI